MIRRRLLTFVILSGLLTVASAQPLTDRVRLRSGETVNGSFVSADAAIVRILLANGKIAEYAVADVSAVEFSPRNNARSGAAAATLFRSNSTAGARLYTSAHQCPTAGAISETFSSFLKSRARRSMLT